MDHLVHIDTKRRMWTISKNLKETKLIGQGLADIRQQCVLCKLVTPVLCYPFIRNIFLRFATALTSILKRLYHL